MPTVAVAGALRVTRLSVLWGNHDDSDSFQVGHHLVTTSPGADKKYRIPPS